MADEQPGATIVTLDEEARLMLAFQRGDEAAFDALYRRCRDAVYRFAHRLLGRASAAEEVAQEAWVRVYRARARYRATTRFRTWLFTIVRRLCANERRRASHRLEEPTDDLRAVAPTPSGPLRAAEGAQLARAIEAALLALPERQRAAVVLARYEGCSMAEVGQVLEISEGAAKVLLHRARRGLEQALAPYLDAEAG